MRRFIYLDTNTLDSYISQIDDGLVQAVIEEIGNLNTTSKTNSQDLTTTGTVDLKFLKKGLEGKVEGTLKQQKERLSSDTIKNILNKQRADERFDKFLQFIRNESLIKGASDIEKIGDFVSINANLTIVDLEYYFNLFSDNGFIEFIKKQEKENKEKELDKQYEKLNREERRKTEIKKEYDAIKRDIKEQMDNTYKQTKETISALMSLIPYRKFIYSDDFIIIIDEKFLRDNPNIVANKYGGNVEIVGYLTNKVKSNENDKDNEENIFKTFPAIINSFLLSMFRNTELKIIHPIAIYYN